MNAKDKFDLVFELMIKDKEYNYSYLDTIPIIRTKGMVFLLYSVNNNFPTFDCKYLEYYNNSGKKVFLKLYSFDGKIMGENSWFSLIFI